jgi:hypothetical protein
MHTLLVCFVPTFVSLSTYLCNSCLPTYVTVTSPLQDRRQLVSSLVSPVIDSQPAPCLHSVPLVWLCLCMRTPSLSIRAPGKDPLDGKFRRGVGVSCCSPTKGVVCQVMGYGLLLRGRHHLQRIPGHFGNITRDVGAFAMLVVAHYRCHSADSSSISRETSCTTNVFIFAILRNSCCFRAKHVSIALSNVCHIIVKKRGVGNQLELSGISMHN